MRQLLFYELFFMFMIVVAREAHEYPINVQKVDGSTTKKPELNETFWDFNKTETDSESRGMDRRDVTIESYVPFPFTYPDLTRCAGSKKEISPDHLFCPKVFPLDVLDSGEKQMCRFYPGSLNLPSVKGFLVHKLVYDIYCSENFLGMTTTEKVIREERMFPSDLSDLDLTSLTPPYFPAPNCIWLAERNLASKTFLTITDLDVIMDPYTGDLLDSHFLTGICKKPPCETRWKNSMWVPQKEISRECLNWETLEVIVHKTSSGLPFVITAVGHHPWLLDGACSMTFCQSEIIRTSSGEPLICPSLKVKPCNPGTTVQLRFNQDETSYQSNIYWNREERLNCLSALSEIRLTNKVSALQLSYFRPQQEGQYPVYWLVNNTLLSQSCYYRGIKTIQKERRKLITIEGKTLEILFDSAGNGLNGIYLNSDKEVTIPDFEIIQELYDDQLLEKLVINELQHPAIKTINESEGGQIHLSKTHTVNLDRLTLPSIGSVIGSLSAIILITVGFGIFLYCCLCQRKIICCPKEEKEIRNRAIKRSDQIRNTEASEWV